MTDLLQGASMARKPRKPKATFSEKDLTKGELRKLNALKKSVGEELGNQTFAKWLQDHRAGKGGDQEDRNANLIAEELVKLIDQRNLRIPRGGYLITRGRGRVIVSRP